MNFLFFSKAKKIGDENPILRNNKNDKQMGEKGSKSFSVQFEKAFKELINVEGGYANDPDDKGGETMKGIARNYWKDWEGWEIIDEIKEEHGTSPEIINEKAEQNSRLQMLVKEFYKENFWDRQNLDMVDNYEIAEEIFDTAVNQGVEKGGLYLQKALNLLNNNEQIYKNILDDGWVGEKTIKALNAYMETSNWSTRTKRMLEKTLLKIMDFYQLKKYIGIAESDEEQEKYILGWVHHRIG